MAVHRVSLSLQRISSVSYFYIRPTRFPRRNCKGDPFIINKESMPGQKRIGCNKLKEQLLPLVNKGLKSVLIFGVVSSDKKDIDGSWADHINSPTIEAIKIIRQEFPDILVICDVCLCPFTSSGHCGYLFENGAIDNQKSIKRIAQISLAYAKAGCHVVAPSDMVILNSNINNCYQLPPTSRGLARRAMIRDMSEGADILMVKPCGPYLDIVRDGKELAPDFPMAIYQVSGEYAMLWHASKHGVFSLKDGVFESLESAIRAGANILISYYTPELLDWIR